MDEQQVNFVLNGNEAAEEFCQSRTRVAYPISRFVAVHGVEDMKGVLFGSEKYWLQT